MSASATVPERGPWCSGLTLGMRTISLSSSAMEWPVAEPFIVPVASPSLMSHLFVAERTRSAIATQ